MWSRGRRAQPSRCTAAALCRDESITCRAPPEKGGRARASCHGATSRNHLLPSCRRLWVGHAPRTAASRDSLPYCPRALWPRRWDVRTARPLSKWQGMQSDSLPVGRSVRPRHQGLRRRPAGGAEAVRGRRGRRRGRGPRGRAHAHGRAHDEVAARALQAAQLALRLLDALQAEANTVRASTLRCFDKTT